VILLDTNVLSALMQVEPQQAVVSWLDRQPAESVWTTSITVFEGRFGLALARHGTIATRNVRHFADLSLPVVNPWEESKAGTRGSG
jgi:hypothetical protein